MNKNILTFMLGLLCMASVFTHTLDGQASAIAPFPAIPNQGTFLALSDLHFDPFSDPHLVPKLAAAKVETWESLFRSASPEGFSQYGSDSNYALLVAALKAAREYGAKQHYDYVVVTGDYLAHRFKEKYKQLIAGNDKAYEAFVIKSMIFVSRLVQQSFPNLPVFGSLGNNDSVCGDYQLSPGGAFLAAVGKEWKAVAADKEALHDFAIGGFYALPHPTVPNHELLILNSTFWSANYKDACSSSPGDPGMAELDWFARKLRQLRLEKKTASLIMHIPPGIDGYTSSRFGSCGPIADLWSPRYTSAFLKMTQSYANMLRDGYAGHMHMDDFRVLADATGAAFLEMHMVPAISPIYNNSPAFEIASYKKDSGNLVDYAVIFLTNLADFKDPTQTQPVWAVEYSVDSAYRILEYGPRGAQKIVDSIRSDEKTRDQFIHYYGVQSSRAPSVNQRNWLGYSCAQTEMTDEAFRKCSCKDQ